MPTMRFRCSEEEAESMMARAKESGLSFSEWARSSLMSAQRVGSPQPTHPPAPEKIVALGASQEVAPRPPSRFDGLIPTKAELDAQQEEERQKAREARLSKGSP